MKNDKKQLFERMNLIGEMPVNENVINESVPSSSPMSQILNILDREGYFPMWDNLGRVQFVETEKYPAEYEKFRKDFDEAWRKISLPY